MDRAGGGLDARRITPAASFPAIGKTHSRRCIGEQTRGAASEKPLKIDDHIVAALLQSLPQAKPRRKIFRKEQKLVKQPLVAK
jgi:hypothetical protein